MIFVSVGSSTIPFDRLLHAIDELRTSEHVVVQHGASSVRPRGAECLDFLPYNELRSYIERSRVVVSHAGAGSLITAMSLGKHPIVVPRKADDGEAVDDHQLPFARRVGELGLATVVEDITLLARAIENGGNTGPAAAVVAPSPIAIDLRTFLESAVGTHTVAPTADTTGTAAS